MNTPEDLRSFFLGNIASYYCTRKLPKSRFKTLSHFMKRQKLEPFKLEEIEEAIKKERKRRTKLHKGAIAKLDKAGVTYWNGMRWTEDRSEASIYVLNEEDFSKLFNKLYDEATFPVFRLWLISG